MSIQLSYSAASKYLMSPRYYYLYYIQRIREEMIGSALPYGNAVDLGVNELLEGKSVEDGIKAFNKAWKGTNINGEYLDLTKTDKIKYSKSDYDKKILTEEDEALIKEGYDKSWVSLRRKGHMSIEAYKEQIMPRIKKVIAVQQYVKLPNQHGDKLIGYVDLIAEWEDGRIVVFDNKTSGSKYKKDSVRISEQLGTYFEAVELDEIKADAAGYIVIPKKLRSKKEPLVPIDVIIDDISEEVIEKVFDDYEKVLTGIKLGDFSCLSPQCDQYWGECCYKKYCQSGGTDMTGLVKLKKKK